MPHACTADECVDWCWRAAEYLPQFQAELYRPYYSYATDRPVITSLLSTTAVYGGTLRLDYTGACW